MVSSTPIPMAIAAMVILIISKGMPKIPIRAKTILKGMILTSRAIIENFKLLKIMINNTKITKITKTSVSNCDEKRL